MPYLLENWKNRVASRSDLTGHLIHLTRSANIDGKQLDVIEVLIKIILEQCLLGSSTKSGFICGDRKTVCFQDTPLYQLTQNIYSEQEYRNQNPQAKVRYVGAGLMFPKPYIYSKGGRPVIYDNTEDAKGYLPAQVTGRKAELFFRDNYEEADIFKNGVLEDARTYGDGYDFQIEVNQVFFLIEVKGLKNNYGSIRFTEKEFRQAKKNKDAYVLVVVSQLEDVPKMRIFPNPTKILSFTKKVVIQEQVTYHSESLEW